MCAQDFGVHSRYQAFRSIRSLARFPHPAIDSSCSNQSAMSKLSIASASSSSDTGAAVEIIAGRYTAALASNAVNFAADHCTADTENCTSDSRALPQRSRSETTSPFPNNPSGSNAGVWTLPASSLQSHDSHLRSGIGTTASDPVPTEEPGQDPGTAHAAYSDKELLTFHGNCLQDDEDFNSVPSQHLNCNLKSNKAELAVEVQSYPDSGADMGSNLCSAPYYQRQDSEQETNLLDHNKTGCNPCCLGPETGAEPAEQESCIPSVSTDRDEELEIDAQVQASTEFSLSHLNIHTQTCQEIPGSSPALNMN